MAYFAEVVDHGGFAAAGRALNLPKSKLSRRVAELEERLGVRLLNRTTRSVAPTEAGVRLLASLQSALTSLDDALDSVAGFRGQVAGTVRIGAPDGLGNCFLAAELGALVSLHPGLVVELVPLPRIFSLSRREADLAIVLDQPADGRLVVSRLADYSLGLYAARGYLTREGVPAETADLAAHVLDTGVEDMAYASALDYGALLEISPGRKFRCASVVGQLEAVRAGTGIGILHDFAVNGEAGLVRVLPAVSFRRSYYLLSHPESAAVRRIATCRDFLVRRFREARARFLPEAGQSDR